MLLNTDAKMGREKVVKQTCRIFTLSAVEGPFSAVDIPGEERKTSG
jgi:hypothetical protein